MRTSTVIGILLAVAIVVGGASFYGGMKYGENRIMQNPQALFEKMRGATGGQLPARRTGQPGATDRNPGSLVAGGTFGTIKAIEGNIITLSTETQDIEVITSDSTFIQKMMAVGTEDLEIGENVIVTGSKNRDGSMEARSIRTAQGMRLTDTTGQ